MTEEEAAKFWIEQIVPYIITRDEKRVWESLQTPEERVQFIDRFWERRDPTPETIENEYKEQHYRRLAYANRFFAAGRPGWKTDRGRIFILLGPPEQIDSDPMGRWAHQYPTEVWIYRNPPHPLLPPYMEIAFVDTRLAGDFEISFNLLKDADSTRRTEALMDEGFLDQMSRADVRASNYGRSGTHTFGNASHPTIERMTELALIAQVPERQLRPLRDVVSSRFTFAASELAAPEVSLFRGSDPGRSSVLVTLALLHQDFAYVVKEDGLCEARFEVLAQLVTSAGEVAADFSKEETLALERARLEQVRELPFVYQIPFEAPPGSYELRLAVRDNSANSLKSSTGRVDVPAAVSALSMSSLVLADSVEKLPALVPRGVEPFAQGEYRVVPNPSRVFPAGGVLHLFYEVYGLELDAAGKNALEVAYVFRREGRLYRQVPPTLPFPTDRGEKSVVSSIPLKGFEPGAYRVAVTVTDRNTGASFKQEIPFTIPGSPQ